MIKLGLSENNLLLDLFDFWSPKFGLQSMQRFLINYTRSGSKVSKISNTPMSSKISKNLRRRVMSIRKTFDGVSLILIFRAIFSIR